MVFTRTITKSRVYTSMISMEDGQVVSTPLPSFVIVGVKVTTKNAIKFAKKYYGKDTNLIVTDIEVTEVKYTMDLETFLENAEVSEESEPVSLMYEMTND